jgi:hypothetical protein
VPRDDRDQRTSRQAELGHLGAGDRVVAGHVELNELESEPSASTSGGAAMTAGRGSTSPSRAAIHSSVVP